MNLRKIATVPLAIASAVLWLTAGSASATTLISSGGTAYTGNLVASAEGHVVLDNPIAGIQCGSSVSGSVETHGEGVTASGNISALSFTGCTNSWHVTVVSAGSLQVHATGSGNGTLTSSGATVEATRFGITCRYATSSTDIGTLTGGENSTLDVSAAIPFHSGSGLCGSGATSWTGSYKVTTPESLAAVLSSVAKVVKLNGAGVNGCTFTKVKEVCNIEFTVIGIGEGWKIKSNEWQGGMAALRYVSRVGCTVGNVLKLTESCLDEIEVTNFVPGTNNEWCVNFELEKGGGNTGYCTRLAM